jgi:folate-binding protein YgfZ
VTDLYDAARETAGASRLEERGVLAVSGPDRQKFLHGILSNDVAGRAPGSGCLAALMDVKGHIVALLRVLVAKDVVFLELPAERVERVQSMLAHYRVASPVRFARGPAEVLALLGPRAGSVLAALGAELPKEPPESHVQTRIGDAEVLVARASDLPAKGFVLHVGPDAVSAVLDALVSAGAALLDRSTVDVLRVEDGIPWYGSDVSEENLLHETGLVALFHSPTKGCYLGQEVVARLEGRGGNVSKRLRGLRLETPAAAGTALSAGGAEVGRITTAGISPRLGAVAMAYVHRAHADAGSSVLVDGSRATVVDLPLREPS